MRKKVLTQHKNGGIIRTYVFKVVIEDDAFEDGRQAYHAYCPNLPGARTWGYTKEEALNNIQEVAQMTVESMIEDGEPIPTTPKEDVAVFPTPRVAINI